MTKIQELRRKNLEKYFYQVMEPGSVAGGIIKAYSPPEGSCLVDERFLNRLARITLHARAALRKLDVEFHRAEGVEHLEGWAEANNLRGALESFDTLLERAPND